MSLVSQEEISNLTLEYGGEWGLNHSRRLLHLIDTIGAGQKYDMDDFFAQFEKDSFGCY